MSSGMSSIRAEAIRRVWGSVEEYKRLRMRGSWMGMEHIEWQCPSCKRWGFAPAHTNTSRSLNRCWFDGTELEIVRRAGAPDARRARRKRGAA